MKFHFPRLWGKIEISTDRIKSEYNDVYSQEFIENIMRNVFLWQISHPVKKNELYWNKWARSSFFAGVMAAFNAVGDRNYLEHATAWAEKEQWKTGPRPRSADDQCCGSSYIEIFFHEKTPYMIADLIRTFDKMISNPRRGREDWYWCDSLFMAPPVLAGLAKATEEDRYSRFLNEMWWDAAEFLFDPEENLFYRDSRFFQERTKKGRKVFWSRGNGWVVAGITRILEYLGENDPFHARYIDLLNKMMGTLVRVQGEDGLWRTNLLDPAKNQDPETSGTGLICYALACGINNGWIEDNELHRAAVMSAWEGLVRAVDPDGRLGWVQKIGHKPGHVKKKGNQEYGSGAFLFAGSEMFKMDLSTAEIKQARK